VCGEAAVQPVEKLHMQSETGRTHEADYHTIRLEGVYQGAWVDRILEPPGHLLSGVAAIPTHILLGVPARRPQAQAGTSMPCGCVHQRVGGQADRRPTARTSGTGA